MGMLELLRRGAMVAGVGCFLWLWEASPPVLLEVSRAGFAGEYQRQYGKKAADPEIAGAREMGERLIEEATDPGSAAAFAAEQTHNRLLAPGDAQWTEFYRSLPSGSAYYAIGRPPFAARRAEIDAQFSRSQWAVMYLPVRDGAAAGYIKIAYWNEPKASRAPAALLYPDRPRAWRWFAAALLLYALLPWRRSGGAVAYSRAAILTLDVLGVVFAALFFALPLHIARSTDEALGPEFGTTLFLWCLGGAGLLLVLWAARLASFRVSGSPTGLVVETLWRRRHMAFSEISAAGYVMQRGFCKGLYIRRRSGDVVKLDWAGLLRVELVPQALAQAGIAISEGTPL